MSKTENQANLLTILPEAVRVDLGSELEAFTASPTPAESKRATIRLANSPRVNSSAALIEVELPEKKAWYPPEYARFGDKLRDLEENRMVELRLFADSLESLYDHMLGNEIPDQVIDPTPEKLTSRIEEAATDLLFVDEESRDFMEKTLRYSAMLNALERRFAHDEEKIRARTKGDNRVHNLQRLPWKRYPEEYKTLYRTLLEKEKEFMQTHFGETR